VLDVISAFFQIASRYSIHFLISASLGRLYVEFRVLLPGFAGILFVLEANIFQRASVAGRRKPEH
jgi:hypothetical protein